MSLQNLKLLLIFVIPFSSGAVLWPGTLEPSAYLAINAYAKTYSNGDLIKRRLEVNWFNLDNEQHQVALYDAEPTINDKVPAILVIDPLEHLDELHVTDIQLPQPTSSQLGSEKRCVFSYWVQVEDKATGMAVNGPRCLQLEPSWMKDHEHEMGGKPMSQLFLPATHDSAAFKEYEGAGDDNLITLAVFAQEENLQQQLQWGVRLLDIRVAYYPTTEEKFWLVHGIIKTNPLSEGLSQVRDFLNSSPDVVIFAINSFEQHWDDRAHRDFLRELHNAFDSWWVKPDVDKWDVTLGTVLSKANLPSDQGRIMLIYNDDTHRDDSLFFPTVHGAWANENDPVLMKAFLDNEVENAFNHPESHSPWVAQCQMTPNEQDIILGRWFGLRDMADAINRNVTKWWNTEPMYTELTGTIAWHDFVLSTDMINTAIERNLLV